MEQKSQKEALEEKTFRYKLIQLFRTNTKSHILPFNPIEYLLETFFYLQLLRFPIDYNTKQWLGYNQPIFCYLDLSHYLISISPKSHYIALIVTLAYLNIYWSSLLFSLLFPTTSNLTLNLRRLYFLITKYILLVPLCNIVLSLFRSAEDQLNFVYFNPNFILKAVSIISFALFFVCLSCQTYLNFQFLRGKGSIDRGRRSAYVPTCLIIFFMLSEVLFLAVKGSQLLILNVLNGVLLVMFFLKNEHLNSQTKLIELSFLGVNMLGYLILDLSLAFSYAFSLELFFILGIFLVGGILQLRLYSLEFQIQNINKWPTSEIIIRYAADLRFYLRARDQYLFNIALKGYMEWHRHKCEIEACPSRSSLSQHQQKLLQSGELLKDQQDLLRCQNVIKKIYSDGYRQSPLSNQLQLENSIFLYEKGEKELALKYLLQIEFQGLDKCNYYQYSLLKQKIHNELSEQAEIKFLDLVSELRVKHQEEQIVRNLQKVALLNLDFWSTLNEDHPNYKKLSELAFERISMRDEVRKSYSLITSIASSERVNGLYVHYLEAVENDEAMFNAILEEVREEFKLSERIVLKDWGNTSQPIMVVSIQQQKYGTILDLNSSCALLFGYEKYEVLNHTLSLLLPEQLGDIKQFIFTSGQEQTFFLAHKSGYFIKITRRSQSYNSMSTGMAAVISLSYQLAPQTCFFSLENTAQTIIGVSSSVISLLGLEEKHFYEKLPTQELFLYDFAELAAMAQSNDRLFNLNELIQQKYEEEIPGFSLKQFKLECFQYLSCKAVSLQYLRTRPKQNISSTEAIPSFEFQIQATLDTFKFFGCFNSHEAYLSQFSQLSYAQSLKQGPTVRNYQSGITTLRLRDNIIQVIEENEPEDVNLLRESSSEVSGEVAELPMKEEEEIFSNRRAFTKFIQQISFGKSLIIVMTVGKLSLFALYTFILIMMISHNHQVTTLTSQMVYNNLMGGTIAKQLSLVRSISQMQKGQFYQDYDNFAAIYEDNLKYSSQIKFFGGDQYNLTVFLGVTNVTFLNHEFFLSFLDSSNILQRKIASATSPTQLVQSLATTELTALNYLLRNCPVTKQEIFAQSSYLLETFKTTIDSFVRNELLLMAGGFSFILIITLLKWIFVYKLNKEKEVVLDIFLDINDIQIQTFTSKTEKFLNLLHAEDLNGEIDVDEEVQNIKKLSSSTFNKQKRFTNQLTTDILFYVFIVIGLLYSVFLIDASIFNHDNLQFQRNAADYFFKTSAGQYKFYSGLAQMQASLTDHNIPISLSKGYLQYYKEYFQLHYNTYGSVFTFHDMFTHIHMTDICQGTETPYGSTQIPVSCQLPELYPNGSYLVFIDMAMKTEILKNASSLTDSYLLDYEIVSLTHRKLSQSLIQAQVEKEVSNQNNLILVLVIWIACIIVLGAFFIYRARIDYVCKLNKTKNVITILPVSIAKNLPKLVRYCAKMLANCKCC